MRILYVAVDTPVPGTHGGSVHALELCRALARRGHEVHVLAAPGTTVEAAPGTTLETSPGSGTGAVRTAGIAGKPEAGAAEEREQGARREPEPAGPHGEPVPPDADEATPIPSGSPATPTWPAASSEIVLHPIPRPPRFLEWTAVGRVRKAIRALRPDVVVERFYTFAGAGLWAASREGVPAVLEVNSPARPYPGSLRDRLDRATLVRPVDRWRRRQLERAAAVVTTSRHLVPDDYGGTVKVVVNGVDVERFRPGPPAPDAGPLRLAYVSSFRAWHGAEDLVEAVARCRDDGVEVRVTCVGSGPRRGPARELATERGVEGLVEFPGRVAHDVVPELLAAAHVGLAPFAPREFRALELGWFWSPIKIFEYLAAGLPVVTADLRELRQLLPDDVARFYPAGDAGALAGVIAGLAADREVVRRMAVRARELAETRYTWDRQAADVEEVLAGVTGADRP